MNSKAIKRQLLAAIAMVLVAAIALGSSTYAWFVSNNSVKATVSTISAQSNSPFLKITSGTGTIGADTGTSYSYALGGDSAIDNKALYPVQAIKWENKAVSWQSAYSDTDPDTATEQTGTRFDVPSGKEDSYRLLESFKIGTDGTTDGTFSNLVVESVSINNTTSSQLTSALRLLVVCGDNAVVLNNEGKIVTTYVTTAEDASTIIGVKGTAGADAKTVTLADAITKGASVQVDVYVYYDGADAKVTTFNLSNLKEIGATITFTATADNI